MQPTTPINNAGGPTSAEGRRVSERFNQLFSQSATALVLAVVAAVSIFVADIFVSRGATPAIGYTLVFVLLASRSRQRMFLLGLAAVCTLLTWIGYLLEPAGAAAWMSIFDRVMITMVLWATLALAWARQPLITALAESTKALEDAKQEVQSTNRELLLVNQELQRRNGELNQLNDDLSNLLVGVNLPIVMLCKDLRIRRFTPAAKRAFCLGPLDVGHRIDTTKLAIDLPDLEGMVRQAIAVDLPVEREVQGADGRWRLLSIRSYRTGDNRISGAVLLLFDMDDQKRAALAMREARDVAEEANRSKDLFLAMLSHELRTPLSAILGWAQLLQSEKLDAAKSVEAAKAIESSGRAQAALINDLLDVSRIVAGKMELDTRLLNLTSVVDAAARAVQPAAEAKRIRLEQSPPTPLPPILGDPIRLQQVVWNLLSNAVKFTPVDGRISVLLRASGSWVELIVSDTGAGIAPEFLPHVFDRFCQEENTTARRGAGLGLGLSIVRHLVNLHGGNVEVQSAGKGEGTTFTVRLPIAAILPTVTEQSSSGTPPNSDRPCESCSLNGLRVLVVDDDSLGRSLIATWLRSSGATVVESGSAADALRTIADTPPEVLISDIGMPVEDGFCLIREVRRLDASLGRQTPAIALTAYSSPQDRRSALAAGFNTHMSKPIEPDELIEVIAHLAGRQ